MGGSVFLSKPTADLQVEYLSFYQEWKESGENIVPWVISSRKMAMLSKGFGLNYKEN
ncbi:hypothetical protein EV207_10886 [Scopulibacillus darangshiensis]|uniref:Uncharacterized protein n=1 Tax=Scopulibacillus darangshiensis TaxID=442528 RepID=A0A4R2P6L1_9BACL|nr:hypothetical protein EV207_10886 [Scopulibacillus darangshiensis]